CIWNALKGIFYDFSCWDCIEDDPDYQRLNKKKQCVSKLGFILTRNDRMFYLASLIAILFIIYYIVKILIECIHPNSSSSSSGVVYNNYGGGLSRLPISNTIHQLFVAIILVFVLYYLTPTTDKDKQYLKILAIAIIVIIVMLFFH